MNDRYTFDIECYKNYFLALFVDIETGGYGYFQRFNDVFIGHVPNLQALQLIGFNSNRYDIIMLTAAMAGLTNQQLKELSDKIILSNLMPWTFEKSYGLSIPKLDHIDLIEVAPGKASLKLYGGRMGSRKLQDLPIPPDAWINASDINTILKYCYNDNLVTMDLYHELKPQLELRNRLGAKYRLDLRSKSDAQIAEAVIKSEYENRTTEQLYKPNKDELLDRCYRYNPPPFINFGSDTLLSLLEEVKNADFYVDANGKIMMPNCLNQTIQFGPNKYKLGVGGIHSVDKPGEFKSEKGIILEDVDVTSYYPSIILNAGFYPKHIGPVFLDIYKDLVDTRVNAKESGDTVTADSLKITINGTFGKLGSKWSYIYAPDLMFHVTVTGQLCMLMLIERLGASVISANTDGLTLRFFENEADEVYTAIDLWMADTGFHMEGTRYKRLNRRDISNYITVKEDGGLKCKGLFAKSSMMKNPTNVVCIDAVKAFVQHGTPVKQTIWDCNDVKKFLTVRTVNGGAVKDGQVLGKAIRWYYSNLTFTGIHYKTNGNVVPKSEGAMPMMDLADCIPSDLNRDWYVKEAEDILDSIGA